MRITEMLVPRFETMMRRALLVPVSGSPLERLETALCNVAREVSIFFSFRRPLPVHERHFAVNPDSQAPLSPRSGMGLQTVHRYDARELFRSFQSQGVDWLRSLDEVVQVLVDAPPEWDFLTRSILEGAGSEVSRERRSKAWNCFVGEYIRDYLWLVRDPQRFEPEVARAMFERLARRLARGRQSTYRVTPLFGLWLDGRDLELSPRVRLRPVSWFELHRWLNPSRYFDYIPVRGLEAIRLWSLIEYEEPETQEDGPSWLFNLLRPKLGAPETAVLASLWLLIDPAWREAHIRPVFMERREEGSTHECSQRCALMVQGSGPHGEERLDDSERQQLKLLFERVFPLLEDGRTREHSVEDNSLAVALNRGFASANRPDAKDWLIDCWVALEALFTSRGEPDLTEKCATRISQELAGYGVGSAERLYKQLRVSYGYRCDIVHGDRRLKGDFDTVAHTTREYLRRILHHRLMRPRAP